jgi:hypothetical protein
MVFMLSMRGPTCLRTDQYRTAPVKPVKKDQIVKLNAKLAKVATLARTPTLALKKFDTIVLLSHMRARTSLLSHLLGSHPEIAGYYEQHLRHRNPTFNFNIRSALLAENLISPETRYLFDKTLHTHLDPAPHSTSRKIIMMRAPEETIASIVTMGKTRDTKWQDQQLAFAYYCYRLKEIVEFARQSPDKILFLHADDLVQAPGPLLDQLSSYLGLKTPLKSEYQAFAKTGQPSSGDPSKSIQSGKIVASEKKPFHFDDPKCLDVAQTIYDTVVADLARLPNIVQAIGIPKLPE